MIINELYLMSHSAGSNFKNETQTYLYPGSFCNYFNSFSFINYPKIPGNLWKTLGLSIYISINNCIIWICIALFLPGKAT